MTPELSDGPITTARPRRTPKPTRFSPLTPPPSAPLSTAKKVTKRVVKKKDKRTGGVTAALA